MQGIETWYFERLHILFVQILATKGSNTLMLHFSAVVGEYCVAVLWVDFCWLASMRRKVMSRNELAEVNMGHN